MPGKATPSKLSDGQIQRVSSISAGVLLGLALLKFGNPVIFDRLVERPGTVIEAIFQPWPILWGYCLLGGITLLGVTSIQFTVAVPSWIKFLPILWLGWQGLSALRTVNPDLTRVTLLHFASCVVWFYLGLFALSRMSNSQSLWMGLVAGLVLVLWFGFEQHYGGLEATRRFFYEQPNWKEFPPEYLKRMSSDRIFSTLVYPNALAGVVLLLLPGALVVSWQWGQHLPRILRTVLVGSLAYLGSACLVWSGSKAGWLIALVMAMAWLAQIAVPGKFKVVMAVVVAVVGLTAFATRFAPYFNKGATSVGARFDYWKAAAMAAKEHPMLGTGPGTFSVTYAKTKPPEAEMARLAHNDYLEQASDSGIIGALSYFIFVAGALGYLYRQRSRDFGSLSFAVWIGLLGWALQAFVEFPLYIPALAWPAFVLMGWALGRSASTGRSIPA
ncbi:MAG: O-antigen ligase family protein [Verrucomicrobia bacterium]|nr:O-antigen ligase family protein [Verrucomicrobiota bacterium]